MKKHPLQQFVALLSIAILIGCSGATKIKSVTTSSIEFNSHNNGVDSATYKLIAPYKNEMDKIMNEVLVISDTALLKDLPEGSLGNFVSDAVLNQTNAHYKPKDNTPADICLLNNGGLRAQLPKGKITRGNVFELMPFENAIVVLTLSGEKTKLLFDLMVENNGAPFGGARIKAKGKKVIDLNIGGKPFDINKNYKVVTSDYLASGGDKYDFFKNPIKIDTLNYLLRDAIIDFMKEENKKGNTLKGRKDGRLTYE